MLAAVVRLSGVPACLACWVMLMRGDGVLADRLLIRLAQLRVALAHDLAHAHLGQFLGHVFSVSNMPRSSAGLSWMKAVMTSFRSSRQMRLASGACRLDQALDLDVDLAASPR